MAGFNIPGLLSPWADGTDPNDPNAIPQGLLAALSQGAQMPGSSAMLGAGNFQPMQAAQPVDDPFGGDPRFNKQPAPQGGMPMPAIPSASNPVPSFQQQPDTEQKYGYLDGSQAFKDYANKPAPGAAQAGGAPMPQDGKDQPGFLDKLTGVLGGVYGQGGPGDGLINLGLALMSPGNKAENLMRAGQMGQMADYKKSQLMAAQQKQQREMLALQGNMQTLKQAYPNWSQEQLAAAAQNPSLVQEAVKSTNPSEVWRPLTDPTERQRYGIPAEDRSPYVVDRTGKPQQVGTPKTEVNINQQNEKTLETERSKGLATRLNSIADDGNKSSEDRVVVGRLGELLDTVQTGNKTALLEKVRQMTGVALDPNTDNVQAMNAAIQYLAPRLRVPGSGAQSDKELDNFLRSIPSLQGTPEGNKKILETMQGIIDQRKMRSDVALQWQVGDISAKEAQQKMDSLPSPFAPKADAPDAAGWTTVNGHRVRKVN